MIYGGLGDAASVAREFRLSNCPVLAVYSEMKFLNSLRFYLIGSVRSFQQSLKVVE